MNLIPRRRPVISIALVVASAFALLPGMTSPATAQPVTDLAAGFTGATEFVVDLDEGTQTLDRISDFGSRWTFGPVDGTVTSHLPQPLEVANLQSERLAVAILKSPGESPLSETRYLIYDVYSNGSSYAGAMIIALDDSREPLASMETKALTSSRQGICQTWDSVVCDPKRLQENSPCYVSGYYCTLTDDIQSTYGSIDTACRIPPTPQTRIVCRHLAELANAIPNAACAGTSAYCTPGSTLDHLSCEYLTGELSECDAFQLGANAADIVLQDTDEAARAIHSRMYTKGVQGTAKATADVVSTLPSPAGSSGEPIINGARVVVHDAYCGPSPFC